jgi:hypothetical protein
MVGEVMSGYVCTSAVSIGKRKYHLKHFVHPALLENRGMNGIMYNGGADE